MTGATPWLARDLAALPGALMLLLAFAVLLARRPATLHAAQAGQGALLVMAVLLQAWLQARADLLIVAALTAAAALGAALPLVHLATAAGRAPTPAAGYLAAGSALAATALVALPTATAAGAPLALALAVGVVGAVALALRPDGTGRVAGALGLANGLVLALAAIPAQPGRIPLTLAILALPAVVLMGVVPRPAAGGMARWLRR